MEIGGDNLFYKLVTKGGVENGKDDFDAAMEVAGHQIGAAKVDDGIASIGKNVDTAVFKVAIDNAANVDVFAQARDAGAEAADAANEELDGDTFLGAGVERLDDFGIDEGVGFDENSGRSTGAVMRRFAVNIFEEAGDKIEGGDEEFIKVGGLGHAGEDIEERGDFGGEAGAGGEEAKIGIKPGGAGVVIARAEVKIGLEVSLLPANDEKNFAVSFESD